MIGTEKISEIYFYNIRTEQIVHLRNDQFSNYFYICGILLNIREILVMYFIFVKFKKIYIQQYTKSYQFEVWILNFMDCELSNILFYFHGIELKKIFFIICNSLFRWFHNYLKKNSLDICMTCNCSKCCRPKIVFHKSIRIL